MAAVAVLCLAFPRDGAAQGAALPWDSTRFEASLTYRTGQVDVGDGLATLDLPDHYRFLGADDAERVLRLWGNPPGSEALGMIVPDGYSASDDGVWVVVVSYEEDGFVDDDDASSIDYGELLEEMQADARKGNPARERQGYEPVTLVGWAAPPRYDVSTRKLYWAKELQFGDAQQRTLNYDVRALGRRGVLVLEAVASMDQLDVVEPGMQRVIGFVDFNAGHRYADFVPGTDKVAAYGIGALVAGKVAAKAGFFKLLLVGLVAMKKFALLAVIAVGGVLQRLISRRSRSTEAS